MTHRRPLIFLSALSAVALLGIAQPASAQDFFDWLNDPAPKKKEETFKGSVPEAVQRDTLPDLAPPPAEAPGQSDGYQQPRASREPVPRGPDGQAYDNAGARRPAADDDARQAPADNDQFDPLESRRNRYRTPAPTPAKSEWQNPDDVAPRDPGRRPPDPYADEQAMPAEPADRRDRNQYDGGPIDRRQGMQAPPRRDDQDQRQSYQEPQRYSPQGNTPGRVERDNLEGPRTAGGAPYDPWGGIQISELEEMLSKIELPPRSPAVHDLWLRLITARPASPDPKLAAIRADALNRTGLVREAAEALAQAGDVSADPIIATLAARTAIGAGNTEKGCDIARSLTSAVAAKMPPHMKGEVILIAGFCAAASDNKAAAGIAGDLATENGLQDHAGPAALKAIAAGHKPAVQQGKKVSLLDYRILQLGGPVDITYAIPTASPALLAVIARDDRADPSTRLAAAEAAAGLNAISVEELAAAYRAHANPRHQIELNDAVADAGQPIRRAALFVAAETERSPLKKARVIRAFLDEARRAGFYWPALQLMAHPANDIQPLPEIGWFAETAVEASLAGGAYDSVHRWVNFAGGLDGQGRADLRHWLALADIAEPDARDRTQHLVVLEDFAQQGRFEAPLLHRLATALDALDTNVPIPLWEAASRTEQPSGGHLPDTGILSQLQDAAKKRDFARTVLLAMRTMGSNGAEGAHMIALGDSIRALKHAGLEAEARRVALEALFGAWPRATNS